VLEQDIYEGYLTKIGEIKKFKGKQVHCVNSVEDEGLAKLLGKKWYKRILNNKNGDFSYVIKGTIQFWLHQKPSIKEYLLVGKQLVENEIDLLLIANIYICKRRWCEWLAPRFTHTLFSVLYVGNKHFPVYNILLIANSLFNTHFLFNKSINPLTVNVPYFSTSNIYYLYCLMPDDFTCQW
jgi:hypothetical protein